MITFFFTQTLRISWKSDVFEVLLKSNCFERSLKKHGTSMLCVCCDCFGLSTEKFNQTYHVEMTWYVHVHVTWGTHIVYLRLVIKKSKRDFPPTYREVSEDPAVWKKVSEDSRLRTSKLARIPAYWKKLAVILANFYVGIRRSSLTFMWVGGNPRLLFFTKWGSSLTYMRVGGNPHLLFFSKWGSSLTYMWVGGDPR